MYKANDIYKTKVIKQINEINKLIPTVLGTVKWNIDYYRKIKNLKLMKSI